MAEYGTTPSPVSFMRENVKAKKRGQVQGQAPATACGMGSKLFRVIAMIGTRLFYQVCASADELVIIALLSHWRKVGLLMSLPQNSCMLWYCRGVRNLSILLPNINPVDFPVRLPLKRCNETPQTFGALRVDCSTVTSPGFRSKQPTTFERKGCCTASEPEVDRGRGDA